MGNIQPNLILKLLPILFFKMGSFVPQCDEHKLKASLVVWSRIDRGRKVLEHYIVTWKGNRDFFHLSQLNWPSLANALSGIEEGVLKLAAQAALAMPEELKDYSNPIQSYRDYYHLDKATFASWKYRDKPHWWDEELADYDKRISGQ